MARRTDFQDVAQLRITEAQTLLDHHLPDGAFYLAGYAVECALKAAICKTLGIDDFFEPNTAKTHSAKVQDDVLQKFKTHDYGTLLALSGLYYTLEAATVADISLGDAWTVIRRLTRTEQYRYETVLRKEPGDVKSFVDSIHIFLQWIKTYW